MTRESNIRLAGVIGFAVCLYVIYFLLAHTNGGIIFMLLLFPFAIGVVTQTWLDTDRSRSILRVWGMSMGVMGGLALILLLIKVETVICVVMASPLLAAGSILGVLVSRFAINQFDSAKAGMPILTLAVIAPLVGLVPPPSETGIVVTDTIDIAAPPDAVWAQIIDFPTVKPEERLRTLSHLIGAPQPVSSSVRGDVRTAHWTKDVTYEEHITQSVPGEKLRWTFTFAPDFKMAGFDEHISPNSGEFTLLSGGYDLTPVADGTRLTLHTEYRLNTILNGYIRLWGSRFLSDNQKAVMHVIAQRAEAAG